jgi:hypothetical protein
MIRTFQIIVTVEVDDDYPYDESQEAIEYRAYEQARDGLVRNTADWYVEEAEVLNEW